MEKEFGLRKLREKEIRGESVDDLKVGLKLGLFNKLVCGVCLYNSHML